MARAARAPQAPSSKTSSRQQRRSPGHDGSNAADREHGAAHGVLVRRAGIRRHRSRQYADTNLVSDIKERLSAAASVSERVTSAAQLLFDGPEALVPAHYFAWEAGAPDETGVAVVVYHLRHRILFEEARWGRACRDLVLTANDVKTKVVVCRDWAPETPGPNVVGWVP